MQNCPAHLSGQSSGSGQQPVGGVGAISPLGQVLLAHLTVEQSKLEQRLRSGQHSPSGIGGFVPSLQTCWMQNCPAHLSSLGQRSESGQQPVDGVGAISPLGQVLSAQRTAEQSFFPQALMFGQHLPVGIGANVPSRQYAARQRTRSQFRLWLLGRQPMSMSRRNCLTLSAMVLLWRIPS